MLKRLLPIFLIALLLAGCQLPIGGGTTTDATPTMTDNEMATKVAQILTTMPSSTPATLATEEEEPTDTETVEEVEPTEAPEVTSTPETSESTSATATVTPTTSATVTGDVNDPVSYLGDPTWEDTLDKGTNWAIDTDAYSIGKISNGNLVMTGRKAFYAWRLADTDKITNAYLEATLKIDSCSGKDAHGIMFRVPSFSAANKGYLFGITCDGNYFLNKYDGTVGTYGKMTTLIDYTASSAINKGAKQTNRVGVLLKDKTMTFFINGKSVVSKTDSTYTSGNFGLFVQPVSTVPLTTNLDIIHYWTDTSAIPSAVSAVITSTPTSTSSSSTSATATTTPATTSETSSATAEATEDVASLSDLLLTPVATSTTSSSTSTSATATATSATTTTPGVTATATVTPTLSPDDPAGLLGDADWVDLLNDNKNFVTDEDKYSIGKIQNGYLVMTGKRAESAWRLADTTSLTNVYVEAIFLTDTASCLDGDSYGLFFRVPTLVAPKQGYLFGITCDGKYYLNEWDGKTSKLTKHIDLTSSSAINKGKGVVNKVGVLMVGDKFQLYVNGVPLAEISDKTFTKGYFGIFVRPSTSTRFTIKLDEIRYWID